MGKLGRRGAHVRERCYEHGTVQEGYEAIWDVQDVQMPWDSYGVSSERFYFSFLLLNRPSLYTFWYKDLYSMFSRSLCTAKASTI